MPARSCVKSDRAPCPRPSVCENDACALQIALPGLADQVLTETPMWFRRDQREAGVPVDVALGEQDALGPQRYPLVALLACSADALLDQRAPDAEPARLFLHKQQAQLGEGVGGSYQKDRAERLAVSFRNPAMLARRVIVLDELGADLGDQRLIADVPAIFIGIGDGLSRDHPAHVADAMAAQQEGGTRALRRLQQILDRGHGSGQAA